MHNDTKTIKPSGDIITDYNVFLRVALHRCIVARKHYHVCICDQRNDKQQGLLYTAQNSRLNSQWQII